MLALLQLLQFFFNLAANLPELIHMIGQLKQEQKLRCCCFYPELECFGFTAEAVHRFLSRKAFVLAWPEHNGTSEE